jgi:hypothetical protein
MVTPHRELAANPMGYYHIPAWHGGLSQTEYRKLSHSWDSTSLYSPDVKIDVLTQQEARRAQLTLVNAALRTSQGEVTPELKAEIKEALRSCGLYVDTRPVTFKREN